MAIAKDGTIYYSVSSTKYPLHEGVLELLSTGSPNGRVLRLDPETKESTLLLDGLVFANGVALSKDEDFLIVSDLGKLKLWKFQWIIIFRRRFFLCLWKFLQ